METHDERFAKIPFAKIYPMYLAKVMRKEQTKGELDQVIEWLTGYEDKKRMTLINENVTLETFFRQATLNPKTNLISGVICGYRVEKIVDPF